MAIMATAMHLSGVLAGMRKRVELLQGQRVEIRAQTDRASPGGASLNNADYTGTAESAMDRDTPFLERLRDDICSTLFFVAKLGVCVEVSANCLNFRLPIEKGLEKFHANHFK
jgi:hypothetical protein